MLQRIRFLPFLPLYVAIYFLFLYLPILLLPVFSFNDAATTTFPLAGFTTKWYASLWGNSVLLQAARNSLVVGVCVSLLSTILGICAARAITRYRFRGQRAAGGLIMAPLFLPEIIVAVSLLMIALQFGLQLSLVTVILGQVVFCIPYSMSVLVSGFEGFDRSLEEASYDLGETAFGTFRRVTLPVVAPAIVSSLLVTFTISLDEFILAFFLSGTEPTLPVYIWGQLRFAAKLPGVLALGSLMILASVVLLTVAEVLRRRAERRTQAALAH
ncbi:ABC-type spermidine/putrescine transport system permease subunit II [Rhizobium subbaraonis]|uniref:ABC-type spermidine/putrescine transport system permease subunit II n=1 Tax=Rhizobium subbaraonis TaxID=908946 RepID=A0A285UF85_9HYPH|nr:ABC transporter permease [Rhizobium subbaraonis]SOC40433.1 ABC-type spermidine/putrescine transport system permease subunit II [Rhizobium subbaraonis]